MIVYLLCAALAATVHGEGDAFGKVQQKLDEHVKLSTQRMHNLILPEMWKNGKIVEDRSSKPIPTIYERVLQTFLPDDFKKGYLVTTFHNKANDTDCTDKVIAETAMALGKCYNVYLEDGSKGSFKKKTSQVHEDSGYIHTKLYWGKGCDPDMKIDKESEWVQVNQCFPSTGNMLTPPSEAGAYYFVNSRIVSASKFKTKKLLAEGAIVKGRADTKKSCKKNKFGSYDAFPLPASTCTDVGDGFYVRNHCDEAQNGVYVLYVDPNCATNPMMQGVMFDSNCTLAADDEDGDDDDDDDDDDEDGDEWKLNDGFKYEKFFCMAPPPSGLPASTGAPDLAM